MDEQQMRIHTLTCAIVTLKCMQNDVTCVNVIHEPGWFVQQTG